MTTATPLAHYGAVEGALPSGFATAELHHVVGHDPRRRGAVRADMALMRRIDELHQDEVRTIEPAPASLWPVSAHRRRKKALVRMTERTWYPVSADAVRHVQMAIRATELQLAPIRGR